MHRSRQREGASDPDRYADHRRPQPLTQYQAENVTCGSSEGNVDADLTCAARDRVGHHAVNAGYGEQERSCGERYEQGEIELPRGQRGRENLRESAETRRY